MWPVIRREPGAVAGLDHLSAPLDAHGEGLFHEDDLDSGAGGLDDRVVMVDGWRGDADHVKTRLCIHLGGGRVPVFRRDPPFLAKVV